MSLAQGRTILSIPGPSVMPDRVLNAMHQAAPNIYAGPQVEMMPGLIADLKAVARCSQHVAIYVGNGHAGWEAVNANVFRPGDTALSLVTGHFGIGWAEHARKIGIKVETLDFGNSSAVDASQVEAALRADSAHAIRAVLLTHVETSNSALNDVAAVRRAIDAAGHPALLMVDCIASMGCDRFEFDAWGVDVAVAASQKGLMVPPGLAFAWISDKAMAVTEGETPLRSPYWDWRLRSRAELLWQYFFGTPPTHMLWGLREALTMIVTEEGLDHVWYRHDRIARAVWAAVEAWGQGNPGIRLNIADPSERARAVTGVRIEARATELRAWMEANTGVTLGIGLVRSDDPAEADSNLRIGHMGHVNAHMILGTLGAMEAGLIALGIPHGPGGLAAAARVIAGE